MIETLALLYVLSDVSTPTLPRHGDVVPVDERPSGQEHPTDPLFDREYVATDDPAFVLLAVESARQGIMDARSAQGVLRNAYLVAAAERIRRQNESAYQRLEALAKDKSIEPGRRVGEGTFALQAHDPGSTVMYRNIKVKRLP